METDTMLHPYGIIALDLAMERVRDLEREAARRRLGNELRARRPASRPGRVRSLAARPLRALSSATQVIADAACTAATRLEGRSA